MDTIKIIRVMTNPIKDSKFFEGGNAIFTVSNAENKHYTYKIRKVDEEKPFFVSLLTGPDNESSYTYMGIYNPKHKKVYAGKKAKYTNESIPVKVINWAINVIANGGVIPEGYAIQHEGKCCACGRKLTTPESVTKGIGPECEKRQ